MECDNTEKPSTGPGSHSQRMAETTTEEVPSISPSAVSTARSECAFKLAGAVPRGKVWNLTLFCLQVVVSALVAIGGDNDHLPSIICRPFFVLEREALFCVDTVKSCGQEW